MSVLGPHVIASPGSLPEFMAATGSGVIKYLNPDSTKHIIGAGITIGRVHAISEDDTGLLADPAGLGRKHAAQLAEWAGKTGITLWEGLNERNPDTEQKAAAVCAYELARTSALNAVGLFAVVCNFGVGHPNELADGSIDWEAFRDLLEHLKPGNYLGAHEYWLPREGGPLHPDNLHHRAGRILRCPFDVPILITEAGIDVGGGQDDGFRGQGVSVERYAAEIGQYRDLMATDPRVKGITVFTYGNTGQWSKFDLEPDWRAFVAVFAAQAPAPQLREPIRVLVDGQIKTLELEEYLRGVVPAEMPALWHVEALCAQAVAARSYAMACIEAGRADYDVTDDAHFQVYNPAMIHPRSDLAIADTMGVYVRAGRGAQLTEYKAHCGRTDCPDCQGANGTNGRVWQGQMCQYGARLLAEQGNGWRAILRHYYGSVRLSDESEDTMDFYKDPATDAFAVGSDGKVTGCRVDILKDEIKASAGAKTFRVVNLRFLNEEQARGDTRILVSVLDKTGAPTMAKVINAWPQQKKPRWDGSAYDWASPGHTAEFAMGGGNYSPDKDGPLGPYVIYIEQDEAKQSVTSDMCVGFGLPGNRHVGYQVVYQEQAVAEKPPVIPEPATPTTDMSGCNLILAAIARLIESLIRK